MRYSLVNKGTYLLLIKIIIFVLIHATSKLKTGMVTAGG